MQSCIQVLTKEPGIAAEAKPGNFWELSSQRLETSPQKVVLTARKK